MLALLLFFKDMYIVGLTTAITDSKHELKTVSATHYSYNSYCEKS